MSPTPCDHPAGSAYVTAVNTAEHHVFGTDSNRETRNGIQLAVLIDQ